MKKIYIIISIFVFISFVYLGVKLYYQQLEYENYINENCIHEKDTIQTTYTMVNNLILPVNYIVRCYDCDGREVCI